MAHRLLQLGTYLNTASDAALRLLTAGTFRIKQFTQEHDLPNWLYAYMWLLKTYSIPAVTYAIQVWAALFLRQGPILTTGP